MTRQRERGFSALLMIGVIVLMGGMLAYGVSVTGGMNNSLAVEISVVRAQQAAQAGLEWGRYRIRTNQPCTASFVPPLSAGGTTVTVSCQQVLPSPNELGTTVNVFRVTATACNQPLAGVCPNAAATADYVRADATALVYR